MATPLPDPAWQTTPGLCLRCGYDLNDLAAPGVCPECGWAFSSSCLLIYGIPASGGGPVWRRVAWAGLAVAGFAFSMFWPLLLMIAWPLPIGCAAASIGGMIYLLSTSKRERRGTERLLFCTSGLERAAEKLSAGDRSEEGLVLPWGDAVSIDLRPVGPFWAKLAITNYTGADRSETTFRAGVRCPKEMIPEVQQTLETYARGGAPSPLAPPTVPTVKPKEPR